MDCSPPDSSVHGILQGRILEWVAFPSPGESSQPRNQTQVCIAARFLLTELWGKAQELIDGKLQMVTLNDVGTGNQREL